MTDFNPMVYPACLQRPERLETSAWIQHIPFAMFLVETVRPEVLVELGTHTGVSYCAFCQSVKSLILKTKCYAVDTWVGDPQAGHYGFDILDDLKRHHDPLYGQFSTLIQSSFDEALESFTSNTINILHIDGFHTYEAVKSDFHKWLPKMSNSGIVLLHDHCVREGEFGVWKLWEELKGNYPCFEFTHGYGLAVIAVGEKCPQNLEFLFRSDNEVHHFIKSYFYNLGMRWQLELDLNNQKLQLEALQQLLSLKSESKILNYKRMVRDNGWNYLFKYLYERLNEKTILHDNK